VNVDGAANVAAAAARAGARLVHLSTDFVFDGTARRPYREEDAAQPLTPYGRTKLEGEQRALGAASGVLVVRTSLIYGGALPSPHERMVLDAIDGTREVAFFEDEFRCPVAVADLADGLLELCPQAVAGVLHVAGPESLSRLAFARAVAEAAGLPPERLRTARSADQPVPRPLNCALDCSRAQRLLGTRMRRVTEVLGQRPALT
jgi:dTDP-4-dehydrorhamnose reductase